MANFAIDPQEINPQEYTNASRSLSPYYQYQAANKSGEILTKGLGEEIALGAESADATMKRVIDYKVHQQTDPQQEGFITALEDVKQMTQGTNSPTVTQGQPEKPPQVGMYSNVDYGTVPQAITNGLDKIDTYQQGRTQGKVTETQYLANMYSIAKSMRAEFPGYRDYVDQKMHEITGRPIANLYMSSLLEDINRNSTGENKFQSKLIDDLNDGVKEGVVFQGMKASDVLQGVVSGNIPMTKAYSWINGANAYKYNKATQEASVYAQGQSDSDAAKKAETLVVNNSTKAASDTMTAAMHAAGIDTDSDDVGTSIQRALAKYGSNSATAIEAGKYYQRAYTAAYNQAWMDATKPGPNGEPSLLNKMGNDVNKLQTVLDKSFSGFKQFVSDLSDGNVGLAAYSEKLAKAKQADAELGLYQGEAGKTILNLAAASKAFGPSAGPWLNNYAISQLNKKNVHDALEKDYSNIQENEMMFPSPGQKPKTLQQVITDTNNNPKLSKSPMLFDDYINTIKWISDPSTPEQVKINMAHAFFSPENRNVLDNFKTDYTDPQTGRHIPAKYSVFTRMTSPDVTKAMYELGQTDPNLWKMYQNWTEEQFGFKLFSSDIKQLNALPEGIELKFHPETHHFAIERQPTSDQRTSGFDMYSRGYQDTVDNLNLGLDSLYNVEREATRGKGNARDTVNAYLLNVLRSQGFDPQHPVAKSIIDGIKQSIGSTVGGAIDATIGAAARKSAESGMLSGPIKQRKVEKTLKDQERVLPGGLSAGQ